MLKGKEIRQGEKQSLQHDAAPDMNHSSNRGACMTSRLTPEDQSKVDSYLAAPQHQVQRQPFRPWRLLLIVLLVVIGLGVLSRLLSGLVN
jgi:hypothetical protein